MRLAAEAGPGAAGKSGQLAEVDAWLTEIVVVHEAVRSELARQLETPRACPVG